VSRRAFVFAIVFALVSAVPTPARAEQPRTRRAQWSVALDGRVWGTATDRDGVVVTSDNGAVRALDRRGHTRWETDVPGAQDGNPAITRSRVVVGRAGRVVALARRDGAVVWEQPMDDDEVASIALAGGVAVAGDASGTMRAFDARRGTVHWSVHHEGALRAPARVDVSAGAVLAVWSEADVPVARVLDLASGAERWQQPVGEYTAAPQLSEGRVFVATGDGHYDAWVGAFDLRTGSAQWKVGHRGSFMSNIIPAADAHDLVVVDWIGNVTSIDPATGASRWTTALDRHVVDARVVLLSQRVAVATVDGALFVLDRATGRVVAREEPHQLHGWAGALAPFGRDALVVALRVVEPPRLEVRRVP
jgi:outer membrane protein assembly factor BamB